MKIVVLLGVLLCMFKLAHSQGTDTLGLATFMQGTETLYESPNGGYAFGNNGYGDKVKAQTFSDSTSFVLKEALLRFGAVEFNSLDSSSSILVNVYLNNGPGITLTNGDDSIAPGDILATREIPVFQLVENDYMSVDFSIDTLVFSAAQAFSIGLGLDNIAIGDTVGLISTTDGDAGGSQDAWELTVNDNWIVVAQPAFSWNLDVDLGIFAVIDRNDPTGITSQLSVQTLTVFPNPTRGELELNLTAYEYSNGFNVLIINQVGQNVWSDNFNVRGVHRLDLNGLPTGVYSIRVSSSKQVGVGKFVKQ